jgi:alkylhydroperoxidase family enzyme
MANETNALGPMWSVVKATYIDVAEPERAKLPAAWQAVCEYWLASWAKRIEEDAKRASQIDLGGAAFVSPPQPVEGSPEGAPPLGVPAADRIVSLNHNEPEFQNMIGAIDQVTEAVREKNDLPPAFERERVLAELQAGLALLKANPVRVNTAEQLLADTLRWVHDKAEEFGLGVIASLAATALTTLGAFILHLFS